MYNLAPIWNVVSLLFERVFPGLMAQNYDIVAAKKTLAKNMGRRKKPFGGPSSALMESWMPQSSTTFILFSLLFCAVTSRFSFVRFCLDRYLLHTGCISPLLALGKRKENESFFAAEIRGIQTVASELYVKLQFSGLFRKCSHKYRVAQKEWTLALNK